MTYAGFKSYLYAKLDKDDERVKAALSWIQRNYGLDQNPGLGKDGMYYYFLTFARALNAWGEKTIDVKEETGTRARNWRADLVDRLAALQKPDGSFASMDERWMEGNPVLITAYALLALEHARE
jgi:squalene-hopene/tetraprenyl-beta-curcumene cyclase